MKTQLNKGNIRRAFSLVELIVVILVIAVMMGIGAGVMKNLTTAKGVSSSVPVAQAVFTEAREVARSKGVPARVVIFNGGASSQEDFAKHLRYMGVATQRGGEWKLVGKGVSLASGTFFNERLSNGAGTGQAVFPGVQGSRSCFYYEFNGEGIMASGSDVDFVVQTGKLSLKQDTPIAASGSRDVGGFKIWKTGQTAMYRNAKHLLGEQEAGF